MKRLLMSRTTKVVVFLACLVPLALLIWRWRHHQLGANWVEAAQRWTGDWILRYLILTLSVTPLRRVPGLNALIRYRRMLGLFAFFYACVHFSIYLWYDKGLDWQEMWEDFTVRRFYIVGLLAFVLLIPLAITSTQGWIRRLGRKWLMIHRLVYLSASLGALHYYLQGKSIVMRAVYYGCVVALLLLYRIAFYVWKTARTPKPVGAIRS